MRLPDPIANTTTEAYLAYKAGVLAEGDLKPKLYDPYIHLDAWLAYWTGLVNTYPLDKNNDPEMLTDEEAYIAYLSGVTDTYPEEFRDPADIRVAAYLRYLISARFGRPEYPVNNEELYLSMQKPPYIPSGEPSSDIVIEDTIKAPFVDVKMYGDTFQQSYTGKNLFEYIPTDHESQGLISTIDSNGVITVTGTGTARWSDISQSSDNASPSGTYTITVSTTGTGTLPRNISLRLADGNNSNLQTVTLGINESVTETLVAHTKWRVFLATDADVVYNCKIKIQVEAGSDSTSFEPYVGGQPSPSPDYPQQIQTVTGTQTVEVTGKNLFDKDNAAIYALNPVTSGSALSPLTNACSIFIPITGGEKYTVSTTNRSLLDTYASVYFISGTPDTATTWITRTQFDQNSSVTVTAPAGATYLGMYFLYSNNQTTIANAEATIQIERGPMATPYAAFIKRAYPINLGKNLLAPTITGSRTNQGATVSYAGDKITLNRPSGGYLGYRVDTTTLPMMVKQGQSFALTLKYKSGTINTDGTYSYRFGVYGVKADNSTERFIDLYLPYDTATPSGSIVGTATSDYVGLALGCYISGATNTTTGDVVFDVQLERGTEATDYAAYFDPIELCKLGTYQDYIWKDGEDWKVHKATGEFVFTAETTPTNGRSKNGNTGFVIDANNNPLSNKHIPLIGACSHFDTEDTTTTWTGINRTGMNTSGALWFQTGDRDNPDIRYIAQFFEWLASSNTTYYYALATPTDITITNQALIDQLDALVSGGAENGTTYIKVDATDPNLPGLLYVEAPKYE